MHRTVAAARPLHQGFATKCRPGRRNRFQTARAEGGPAHSNPRRI